jgi:hypothetical protein
MNPDTDHIMLEILRKDIESKKPQPQADTVPTIRFDVPPITTETILEAVKRGRGPWRNVDEIIRETKEEERRRKYELKYGWNEIPKPEWDEDL